MVGMMTKVQIASVFTAVLVAAPSLYAQRKASIPFHVSALGDTTLDETLTGVFSEEVPAGKRLVVQHVSLNVFGLDITEELVLANCMITGRGLDSKGNSQDVQHFIPLTSRANLATGRILTVEDRCVGAWTIGVTCSSNRGQNLAVLQAHLSGGSFQIEVTRIRIVAGGSLAAQLRRPRRPLTVDKPSSISASGRQFTICWSDWRMAEVVSLRPAPGA